LPGFQRCGEAANIALPQMPSSERSRRVPPPPAEGAWLPLYVKVFEGKRRVFGRYVAEIGRDAIFRVDAVTLPLSQDGRSFNRMIEVED
jgi:hypothetical protein